MPADPWAFSGQAWPKMCLTDKSEGHFFGIGDWGGDHGGRTWVNPGKYADRGCPKQPGPDDTAQAYVARQMKKQAADLSKRGLQLDFVLNAGDNFYPGGLEDSCKAGHKQDTDPTGQIAEIWNGVYGETVTGAPWFSVLGNHDWGGMGWSNGWDAQIFHTWKSQNHMWRMPAPFWSQRIEYHGFSVEIFNLDSNNNDAVDDNPGHRICQATTWRQSDKSSCHGMDLNNCPSKLQGLWDGSMKMLKQGLSKKNKATWTIVNTHFPVAWYYMDDTLTEVHERYGIDLMYTGHTHSQETGYAYNHSYIISGGGGGVTSDGCPTHDGDDLAYGFIDFTINATTLSWNMHSHGGVEGQFPQITQRCSLTKGQTVAGPICTPANPESVQV